jgi:type II restriction enzyme
VNRLTPQQLSKNMAAISFNNDSSHGMCSYVSSKGNIIIKDAETNKTTIQKFKVMSLIGKPHFLYKATNLTNFKYRLSENLSEEQVVQINSMMNKKGQADIKGRVRAILKQHVSLEFSTINPDTNGEFVFLENLMLVDSMLPQIISHLLVMSYCEDTRLLDVLTEKLSESNPLGFPMKTNKKQYEAKVRRLVTDIALGMVPGVPWESAHQSYGMLVVNTKGEIDCYHIVYRKSLEDYLYKNLKFETASASRYGFGKIETGPDGCQYFTLNLQLRFTK